MEAKFTPAREVDLYTLPLPEGLTITHPERVKLILAPKLSLDLGALCYRRRQSPGMEQAGRSRCRVIDPASLDARRRNQVCHLIGQINTEFRLGNRSVASLYNYWRSLFRLLDWCDKHGHGAVLDTPDAARAAYADYSDFLENRYNTHTLKLRTAVEEQRAARDFINGLHGQQDLHHGVRAVGKDAETAREFDVYTLPIPDGLTIMRPERVKLLFVPRLSLDLGALCYRRRQSPGSERAGRSRQRRVDPASLDARRRDQVCHLIGQINTEFRLANRSAASLYNYWSCVLRLLDWCDSHGHGAVLDTPDGARTAYADYSNFLANRYHTHTITPGTAAEEQRAARDFINDLHGRQDLHHGVRQIVCDTSAREPTAVPDEEASRQVLTWCEHLFEGISALLLECRPYPYALTVPDYLNWPENRLWLFPSDVWALSPDSPVRKRVNRAFDYACGTLRDIKDVAAELNVKNPQKMARDMCRNTVSQLQEANANPWHHSRMVRGMLAAQCYLLLFLADSGMNLAQALSLPWSKGLEAAIDKPETVRQGWRSVKFRANNQTVFFESSVAHMPLLRLYLRLRAHLLKGRPCETLFFGLGWRSQDEPKQLPSEICARTYESLHLLCPSLPRLMPRAWRVAKQDVMIREHGPEVASLTLQHSQLTGLRHYSNGSEVTQILEMSAYLNCVSAVIKPGQTITLTEIPAGGCVSRGHPEPIELGLALEQNCSAGADGCLNCRKYRVHADETDTRKLLSLRYCIRYTQPHAASVEQYERLWGPILQRIQTLLGEISVIDAALVKRVEADVEQGGLHPFWRMRLELLMELGY